MSCKYIELNMGKFSVITLPDTILIRFDRVNFVIQLPERSAFKGLQLKQRDEKYK